ncbi:hypothetical protein B0H10DRAFT_386938 [Mycena sp. CBHHK59/15]|nr:hypothetical protein B0H10DRAFT_386938 [Mycena sp. CBHHK59/15]
MQTINYLKQFPDDIVPLKCIVVFLWLMQVAYTASICQGAYTMAVTDFGQIFALLYTPTALNVAVVVGSIVDHTVQAFFVTRIYKLTRALYISILLWILVALLQAASMTLAAEAIRTDSIPLMEFKWNWLITILFFGDAGLDIVISATLCFYLKKQSREAPKSTSLLVDRLVLYTIQTGLTTSLVALGAAAAFRIAPNEYIWTAFFIAMPGCTSSPSA